MVKLIFSTVMVFIAVVVIYFSLSNRAPMVVDLAPSPFTVAPPVFVVVLVSFVAGFVTAGLVAWMSGGKKRRRARQRAWQAQAAERKVKQLDDKVAGLEATLAERDDTRPFLALPTRPS
ncbi:MAG: lipopolysaccharide assembly protein LapA domain-containing protein [Rhodospirillales bacterium]